MVYPPIESALRQAVADLNTLKLRWALIGGLAISVRSVPRFTKDLDFAVAVANDPEAEDVVHRLQGRGYRPAEILEQDYMERLSGVRRRPWLESWRLATLGLHRPRHPVLPRLRHYDGATPQHRVDRMGRR